MRIAAGGFGHETNSFVPHRADFAYFNEQRDRPALVRGEAVVAQLRGGSYAMSGFVAEAAACDLVPLIWAHGGAGGCVTDDAFERIVGDMMDLLSRSLPVDGLYLDLHGAMVCDSVEDAEGEILRRARAIVGDVPIVASLDYHANVTPEMVANADALEIFRTYPHVDRAETGRRAARTLATLVARGRPPGRALRKPDFLIPATSQCTLVEPSRAIVASTVVEPDDSVVALGYAAGFPPSDLFWCGPAAFAYGWSQAAADRAADGLAALIGAREAQFASALLPAEAAVRAALKLARDSDRPVVIADPQDNPGCGGSADTTGVLRALLDQNVEGAVLGILCDAEAAAAAHAAGEGATFDLALGGRSGPPGEIPLKDRFTVRRLGSGRFRMTGAVVGGLDADLGPMALLRVRGVDVVVSSRRMQAYDRAPFEHLGVDLARCRFIVVKSAVHFRAEFEPLAAGVILAEAPGGFLDDPAQLPFRKLRAGVRLRPNGPEHVPAMS
jgi:microcystin degradation protein MlrC